MSDDQIASCILAFATHLAARPGGEAAEGVARDRAWLDQSGRPTPEGRRLLDALLAQRETRGTYRLAV